MNLPGLRGHLIHCWNTQTRGFSSDGRETEPGPRPPWPGPGAPAGRPAVDLPGGLGPRPRWGLARRVLSVPEPPGGGGAEQGGPGLASPGLLHRQVYTAVLGGLVGAGGARALTGLRLHGGRGEPGGGGLLPVSWRRGGGDGVRGLRAADGPRPDPPPRRAGSVLGGLGPRSPGRRSAAVPPDVMACDADPGVAILQVIIIAKLCQSRPAQGLLDGKGGSRGGGRAGRGGPPVRLRRRLSQPICGAAA